MGAPQNFPPRLDTGSVSRIFSPTNPSDFETAASAAALPKSAPRLALGKRAGSLAEALKFERPRAIRELIVRNSDELVYPGFSDAGFTIQENNATFAGLGPFPPTS
jgi:hypothetical protein